MRVGRRNYSICDDFPGAQLRLAVLGPRLGESPQPELQGQVVSQMSGIASARLRSGTG